MKSLTLLSPLRLACLLLAAAVFSPAARPQTGSSSEKVLWKPVALAILKFNDEAPKSWNIYHTEKRGWVLVRLWKRYLLVGLLDQEVYDIDPQMFVAKGDAVLWTDPEMPEQPVEISDWNQRDIGPFRRVRFRFGKNGHVLELQLPLRLDGRPMY